MMRVALTRSLCDRGPVAAESLYLLQVSIVVHTCVSVYVPAEATSLCCISYSCRPGGLDDMSNYQQLPAVIGGVVSFIYGF